MDPKDLLIPEREPRGRVSRLDDIERNHDRIEDRVTSLGERVSHLESKTENMGISIQGLLSSFNDMRKEFQTSIGGLQTNVISTFYKVFLLLALIVLVSIFSIAALVGGGMYLKGFGFELSNSQRTPNPVGAAP